MDVKENSRFIDDRVVNDLHERVVECIAPQHGAIGEFHKGPHFDDLETQQGQTVLLDSYGWFLTVSIPDGTGELRAVPATWYRRYWADLENVSYWSWSLTKVPDSPPEGISLNWALTLVLNIWLTSRVLFEAQTMLEEYSTG